METAKRAPAPKTKRKNKIQKINAFDITLLIVLSILGLMIIYPF